MLTFSKIREMNLSRCEQWHGIKSWSIMEWACAMAGEAGELCNVAKKIHRIETGIAMRASETEPGAIKLQLADLAEEAADIFIYLDLVCASRGIDLEAAIIEKFNEVSESYGFKQKL
jgi:NTP pyrophosphatase (non-canonical NTP hydrolase)